MIRVPAPKEPAFFDAKVRRRGKRWLASGSDAKPPPYWRDAQPALAAAFSNRCGYTAMWDLTGTVDHFIAQSRDRASLYEWGNLRYASHWINSSKKEKNGILDPYEVGDDWFEILLPSLELVASANVPQGMQALVKSTLEQLPIGHDERVLRQRRAWLTEYQEGRITLDGLSTYAPLLAAALAKQAAPAGVKKAGVKKAGAKKAGAKKAGAKKAGAKKAGVKKAGVKKARA